jgi:hypothetical protein
VKDNVTGTLDKSLAELAILLDISADSVRNMCRTGRISGANILRQQSIHPGMPNGVQAKFLVQFFLERLKSAIRCIGCPGSAVFISEQRSSLCRSISFNVI